MVVVVVVVDGCWGNAFAEKRKKDFNFLEK